jgi:hypothetical protein
MKQKLDDYTKHQTKIEEARSKVVSFIEKNFSKMSKETSIWELLCHVKKDEIEGGILMPMVNHHFLNRNNLDFKSLKAFLTQELEKPKPNLHIPFHLMLFELAGSTDTNNNTAPLVNVDPDFTYDDNEAMVRLSSSFGSRTNDDITTLEEYNQVPKQDEHIYGVMDGLHRIYILHDLLEANFDKYCKIFKSILCNIVIYYKEPETALTMKKAVHYAKEYSAILADDITKSVGHTLSDGMQECLSYIIAEDNDGTYKNQKLHIVSMTQKIC